jgi:hypothetical protein
MKTVKHSTENSNTLEDGETSRPLVKQENYCCMTLVPKAIFRFNAIPIKVTITLLTETEK